MAAFVENIPCEQRRNKQWVYPIPTLQNQFYETHITSRRICTIIAEFNTSFLTSIRSGQGIFAPFTRQTKKFTPQVVPRHAGYDDKSNN
jgi:hypothetical protein